ncbi:MAG TPA: pilus assembly protein [Aquabacterium sp.]|uniref:pilus assembly protein n=1 Tax=Aquabacterium sp. TaxID=1872578 RepID=UPI002E30C4AE|nr:pilus assembly protein [Aquabacterium sp.]HEX5357518.1 pilus assembly protein [Aquabacterium sp.]
MPFKRRFRAFGVHALFSVAVSAVAALLVFYWWFPGVYRDMCGGWQLFLLLTSVDVVAGPVLTFIAMSEGKSRRHLMLDLSAIVLLQLMALAYGIYAVSMARPVVLAAENGLFRIVTARDLKSDELSQAPEAFRELSWRGPVTVGVRASRNADEMAKSIDWALRGYDAGTRPSYWQAYSADRARVLAQSLPLAEIASKSAWHKAAVELAVGELGVTADGLRATPVVSRQTGWYVLLDAQSAEVKGFARLDEDVK